MLSPEREPQDSAPVSGTLILPAIAAAVYYPLTTFGPGWWRGARLPDMDAPFDLRWLHDFFAWTAGNVGQVLLWVFGATIVVVPVIGAFTRGFRTGPPVVRRVAAIARTVPGVALVTVPVLAVGWFVLTQIAMVIAPWLGMYHGDARPAVP